MFHTKISTFHQVIYSAVSVHENFYELLSNQNPRSSANLQSREYAINVSRLYFYKRKFYVPVYTCTCVQCRYLRLYKYLCRIDPFHLKHKMKPKYGQIYVTTFYLFQCRVYVLGVYDFTYKPFHQHLLFLSHINGRETWFWLCNNSNQQVATINYRSSQASNHALRILFYQFLCERERTHIHIHRTNERPTKRTYDTFECCWPIQHWHTIG